MGPEGLAHGMHRTEAWASKLLKNKKKISRDLLQQVAAALNVKATSLFPDSMLGTNEGRRTFEEYVGDIVDRKPAEKIRNPELTGPKKGKGRRALSQ